MIKSVEIPIRQARIKENDDIAQIRSAERVLSERGGIGSDFREVARDGSQSTSFTFRAVLT
jgi:hypothetical protein